MDLSTVFFLSFDQEQFEYPLTLLERAPSPRESNRIYKRYVKDERRYRSTKSRCMVGVGVAVAVGVAT